jgi:flagellar biosynthesis anti-sigma factor FlgM
MRIDLNPEAQLLPEVSRTANQNPSGAAGQSSVASPVCQDRTQLSSVYMEIRSLAAQAAQLPEAGQEKVSALRQMVLGGSYQPNSEQVAQALFAHMLVQPAS